jgi:hypothetical protein
LILVKDSFFYWSIYQVVNGHHSPLLQLPRLLEGLLLLSKSDLHGHLELNSLPVLAADVPPVGVPVEVNNTC